MQRFRLLRRIEYISVLGEKALLQRTLFTSEGSGKGNGVPSSTTDDKALDEKFLQPLQYILQAPDKQLRAEFAHACNYWLKVPENKLLILRDVAQMFHYSFLLTDDIQDTSTLRRGIPGAHTVFGVARTINAACYLLVRGMMRAQSLNNPESLKVCVEHALEMHWGQGLEIYWRDNYICPSFDEYKEMAKRKVGGGLMFDIAPMQLLSDNKVDLSRLTRILAQYFQIRDDYCNLCQEQYSKEKGYCEDLTEGKFSFPVIHAVMSHPNDRQVMQILRQRTQDVELKKYCVALLEKFGSFSYTRDALEELDAALRAEVAELGGNPLLEDYLDELLTWKEDRRL